MISPGHNTLNQRNSVLQTQTEGKANFYKNLKTGSSNEEMDIPDAEEAKNFWKGIWGQEKMHQKDAPKIATRGRISSEAVRTSHASPAFSPSASTSAWRLTALRSGQKLTPGCRGACVMMPAAE